MESTTQHSCKHQAFIIPRYLRSKLMIRDSTRYFCAGFVLPFSVLHFLGMDIDEIKICVDQWLTCHGLLSNSQSSHPAYLRVSVLRDPFLAREPFPSNMSNERCFNPTMSHLIRLRCSVRRHFDVVDRNKTLFFIWPALWAAVCTTSFSKFIAQVSTYSCISVQACQCSNSHWSFASPMA